MTIKPLPAVVDSEAVDPRAVVGYHLALFSAAEARARRRWPLDAAPRRAPSATHRRRRRCHRRVRLSNCGHRAASCALRDGASRGSHAAAGMASGCQIHTGGSQIHAHPQASHPTAQARAHSGHMASAPSSTAKRTRSPTKVRPVSANELKEFLSTGVARGCRCSTQDGWRRRPDLSRPHSQDLQGALRDGAGQLDANLEQYHELLRHRSREASFGSRREGRSRVLFGRQSTYTDWPQLTRFIEGLQGNQDARYFERLKLERLCRERT